MDFTKLVGLSVVDFVQLSGDAYAFLFDDGIILTVSPDGEAGWVQGTGWEEVWRSLKDGPRFDTGVANVVENFKAPTAMEKFVRALTD